MEAAAIILKIILLISGVISVLAGIIMVLFLNAFLDFDKKVDEKYFTAITASSKKYTFLRDFFSSHGRLAGAGLLLLGIYFLFYFVKIAVA